MHFTDRDLTLALAADFPELKSFLSENYRLRKDIGRAQVFELRRGPVD